MKVILYICRYNTWDLTNLRYITFPNCSYVFKQGIYSLFHNLQATHTHSREMFCSFTEQSLRHALDPVVNLTYTFPESVLLFIM